MTEQQQVGTWHAAAMSVGGITYRYRLTEDADVFLSVPAQLYDGTYEDDAALLTWVRIGKPPKNLGSPPSDAIEIVSAFGFDLERAKNSALYQALNAVTDIGLALHRVLKLGPQKPKDIPQDYKCSACGVHGVKLWRLYQAGFRQQKLFCARHAVEYAGLDVTVDDDGLVPSTAMPGGRIDQIGSLVPAVPTNDGSYWGYTSVPQDACDWWTALPTHPSSIGPYQ